MAGEKINAYLDFELTKKLESFVINALPQQTYMSDFNMMYIANIDITEEDGVRFQKAVESDDSFFLSITNDFGRIDFDIIKTIHVAGVIESDFEVMEYYPDASLLPKFATYYEGNEIPPGGGYMHVAICPFGVNKIEMLNGDVIHVYGNGKIKVKAEQIGFKGYKQIPKVDRVLSNDFFKILKLAIYTRFKQYSHRKYSLNLFSPTMRFISEPIDYQLTIDDGRLLFYNDASTVRDQDSSLEFVVNRKNDSLSPATFSIGQESVLHGVGNMIRMNSHDFIDLSTYGTSIGDEFTIHTNFMIEEYSQRGTVIFEMGYGLTPAGYQTHHITLWVDKDGVLCYNTQYSDEWVSTGFVLEKEFEHTVSFTVENQKYDEEDENEYTTFIHVNGKQIWPEQKMLTPTEKIYLWRAMEAYRTYNEVCMMLPAPDPLTGGLDVKDVCVKKLLQESGFITMENLVNIYKLYLDRPRAGKADLNDIVIGSEENTKIKKVFFGQDSEKDINDPEYGFNGQFAEIAIFSPSLTREEIEQVHMLNILKSSTFKV